MSKKTHLIFFKIPYVAYFRDAKILKNFVKKRNGALNLVIKFKKIIKVLKIDLKFK